MRRIILGTLLIFIPILGLSKDFNIRKELNNEKNEQMVSIGEVNSNQFDYRKPLIFKKDQESDSFMDLFENEKDDLGDNNSLVEEDPGSRLRILFGTPFTIQYVHTSGFGISLDNINPTVEQNGTTTHPEVNAITISYNFLNENFVYGFGLSRFETKSKINGCASYHFCYDGDRDLNEGSLIQFVLSYKLIEFVEIAVGLNSIFFTLDKFKYSDNKDFTNDSDGDLGITHYSNNTINVGFGYIF